MYKWIDWLIAALFIFVLAVSIVSDALLILQIILCVIVAVWMAKITTENDAILTIVNKEDSYRANVIAVAAKMVDINYTESSAEMKCLVKHLKKKGFKCNKEQRSIIHRLFFLMEWCEADISISLLNIKSVDFLREVRTQALSYYIVQRFLNMDLNKMDKRYTTMARKVIGEEIANHFSRMQSRIETTNSHSLNKELIYYFIDCALLYLNLCDTKYYNVISDPVQEVVREKAKRMMQKYLKYQQLMKHIDSSIQLKIVPIKREEKNT